MDDNEKRASENETILMALDQISQTIEVMTSVVSRLRNYMQQQEEAAAKHSQEVAASDICEDRILH